MSKNTTLLFLPLCLFSIKNRRSIRHKCQGKSKWYRCCRLTIPDLVTKILLVSMAWRRSDHPPAALMENQCSKKCSLASPAATIRYAGNTGPGGGLTSKSQCTSAMLSKWSKWYRCCRLTIPDLVTKILLVSMAWPLRQPRDPFGGPLPEGADFCKLDFKKQSPNLLFRLTLKNLMPF